MIKPPISYFLWTEKEWTGWQLQHFFPANFLAFNDFISF